MLLAYREEPYCLALRDAREGRMLLLAAPRQAYIPKPSSEAPACGTSSSNPLCPLTSAPSFPPPPPFPPTQAFDDGALTEARSVVVEEARALVAGEQTRAVEEARDEVRLQKQRLLARVQEELGAQLAVERKHLKVDLHLAVRGGEGGRGGGEEID